MDKDKEETCRKYLLENGVKEETIIKKLVPQDLLDLDMLLECSDEDLKNDANLNMGERRILGKVLAKYRSKVATPKVVDGPKDISLLVGDDIQIKCKISGTPTPKVTWCQGQKTLLADERYHMESTAESATLTVSKATLKDSAQYTLRLDNDSRSDNFTVDVNVKEKRKFRLMICNLEDDETEVTELRDILESPSDRLELIEACSAYEDINGYINKNLEMCDFGLIKVPKTFQYAEGNIAAKLEWAARKEKRKEVTRKLIPVYSKEGDEDSPDVKHLPLMLKIRPLYMHDSDGNKKSKKKFSEELLTYLNGKVSQRIDDLYPQGLIATGLALNYFKPATILLSKEMDAIYDAKFQELKKEHDERKDGTELRKFTKTIIALPADCILPGRNDAPKPTCTMTLTIGNMHGIARDMTFNLYNICIANKIYLVRMDFPNIVTALDKMTLGKGEEATYRKMSEPQRNQQLDDFVTETTTLLDVHHKDKYDMVVFATGTELVEEMKSAIIKDNPGENDKSLLEGIVSQEMEAKFEGKFNKLKKSRKKENFEYKKMMKTIIVFSSDSGNGYGEAAAKLKEVDTLAVHNQNSTIFKVKLFEICIEKEIYLVRVIFCDEKTTEEDIDRIKEMLDIRHRDKYVIISDWSSLDELKKKIEEEIIQSRNEREPTVIVYFEKENTAKDRPEKNTEVVDLIKLETFEKNLPKFGVKLLRGFTKGRPEQEIILPPEGSDEVTLLIWVEKGKLTSFQKEMTNSSLTRQNKNKFKQVFAILADGEQMMEKELTYFDSTTSFKYHAEGTPGYEKFMKTIFRICATKIPLTYPLADVHHGLVWAAALNYLKPVMPGKVRLGMKPWGATKKAPSLRQYCEKLKKDKFPDAVVFPKVILMTEKFCRDAEGTVKHMTIGFKEGTTGKQPNKDQLMTALVKQLGVKEERLAIKELEATPGEFARYKVTLTRSHTSNNYESDLTSILVNFADNVERDDLVVENGEKELEYKVSVAVTGKAFGDFEGIEECMIRTVLVGGVTQNLAKSITTGLFKVTYNGKVYLACFEFVRAVLCIGEIKNENLVPIAPEKMEEQVEEFNKLFKEQAYTIPEIGDHCELLTFNADDEANRDEDNKLNELRLNKIIAEFIQAKTEANPEHYERLEKKFDPQEMPST